MRARGTGGRSRTCMAAILPTPTLLRTLRSTAGGRSLTRSSGRRFRLEAAIVSLFGALLGLVVGLFFGWVAVIAIPESIISSIDIPFGTLAVYAVIATVAGLLAASFPARELPVSTCSTQSLQVERLTLEGVSARPRPEPLGSVETHVRHHRRPQPTSHPTDSAVRRTCSAGSTPRSSRSPMSPRSWPRPARSTRRCAGCPACSH